MNGILIRNIQSVSAIDAWLKYLERGKKSGVPLYPRFVSSILFIEML
jgi:hypothetical protein